MAARIFSTALLLATAAVAKTDIGGCTYYDSVVNPPDSMAYATRVWYVPDTGEICELLDCGGGRAPPKTTVPGCGAYEGTATYSPRYLDLKTLEGQAPETTAASSSAAEASEALTTEAPAATTSASDDQESEETASSSASDVESVESSVAVETSASAASSSASSASASASSPSSSNEPAEGQTTAAPQITTSVRPQDGAGSDAPAASTTPTSTVPDSAAATMPAGAAFGSWVVAGVAVWAGVM